MMKMKITIACLAFTTLLPCLAVGQTETRRQRASREQGAQSEACDASGERRGAHLRMDASFHDFGDVQRRGGDLVHDFEVVNDGTSPLVITRVVTSCSCLKAEFPRRPVPAGGKELIRIVYEPHKSDPGTFHKVIQVYSNSVDGRHVITVQGNSLDPDKM